MSLLSFKDWNGISLYIRKVRCDALITVAGDLLKNPGVLGQRKSWNPSGSEVCNLKMKGYLWCFMRHGVGENERCVRDRFELRRVTDFNSKGTRHPHGRGSFHLQWAPAIYRSHGKLWVPALDIPLKDWRHPVILDDSHARGIMTFCWIK